MPDERFNFDDDSPESDGTNPPVGGAQTSPPPPRVPSAKGQPLVLAVLVFLSVAALVFGGVTIVHNVSAPFQKNTLAKADADASLDGGDTAPTSDASLKKADTDADGLSDYDELRVYRTSPYLKDTDSDTFSDKQEIDSGHDPICPSGKTCGYPQPLTSQPAGGLSPQTSLPALPTGRQAGQEGADPFSQLSRATPEQIRALLLEKGMSPNKLSQLSDEALMQLYHETLEEVKSQQGGQALGARPQALGGAPTLPPLGKNGPTPEQIRQVLRESGQVTEEQLSTLSDQDILNLYQQALERLEKQKLQAK